MMEEPKTYYDVKCDQAYVMTSKTKHLRGTVVPAGTVVYKSRECDYGLANDDTRATGEEYISVTTEPSGRMIAGTTYPFGFFSFTVPVRILRPSESPRDNETASEAPAAGNTNCLAGIACPKCKSEGRFGISVTAFAFLQDDGCESTQDIEWDDQSAIVCCACDHSGTVKEFTGK